jgi:NAD(P)-dependent dehydrogenase (short-subunit alcohol dehydrogenase family)
MEQELTHKTYVVTGATSGIGFATAELLARAGACVIGIGHTPERSADAERRLSRLTDNPQVHYLSANLGVQRDVRRLAERIGAQLAAQGTTALDGLVHSAGVFTYWLDLTPDGVETQWAVNHLAPFLLTNLLMPHMQAAPFARVVTVSSGSHHGATVDWADPQSRRNYNGLHAYGITKLANILFTAELNRRLGPNSQVRAFAADPGLVKTDIGLKGTPTLVKWVWKIRRSGGTPAQVPARNIFYLLTEPSIAAATEFYWKDSRPCCTSTQAQDTQSANRLWMLSAQMCGLNS